MNGQLKMKGIFFMHNDATGIHCFVLFNILNTRVLVYKHGVYVCVITCSLSCCRSNICC